MQGIADFIQGLISAPLVCCGWLLVGAIAGALARRIMGSHDKPLINDIILGLIGAVVGGLLIRLLKIETPGGGLTGVVVSLGVAIVGAMVLIAIGRALTGRR